MERLSLPAGHGYCAAEIFAMLLTGRFQWSILKTNRKSVDIEVPFDWTAGDVVRAGAPWRLRLNRDDFDAIAAAARRVGA